MERHQRRDGGMEAGCHTGDRAKLAQSDERTVTRAIAGAGGGIVLPLRALWPSQIVRIPPVRDRSRHPIGRSLVRPPPPHQSGPPPPSTEKPPVGNRGCN